MLRNARWNEKSYEQLLREAIAQISVYSKDWTNYNVSDPGITILENLSAFAALQQNEMGQVPEQVKWKLLKLAGFEAKKGCAAQAYIAAVETETALPDTFLYGQKLYAHGICFETEQDGILNNARILHIIAKQDAIEEKFDALLDRQGVRGGVNLFGKSPAGGEQVMLYLNKTPKQGQRAMIYFELVKQFERNPFPVDMEPPFAKIKWELLSQNGYKEIAVKDGTKCFLQSGYVEIKIPQMQLADPCILRISLEQAAYDIVPCICRVSGLLTRVVQKDTRSDCVELCTNGRRELDMQHGLLKEGFLELYRRLESTEGRQGLFYQFISEGVKYQTEQETGSTHIIFRDLVPERIMAVCREQTVMAYRELGILYGYDEQVIELPPMQFVYADSFSILVVETGKGREGICHVVKPESTDLHEVKYSLREEENVIIIHDCGAYEGAHIRLGSYAVYKGSEGTVLPGTAFILEERGHKVVFANCPNGENGCLPEHIEQAQRRFVKDLRTPATIVTTEDCRRIVKEIPGLSIHKIGVSAVPERNEIQVVIKPNSLQERPKLSALYVRLAQEYLDKARMLTTKIVIKQPVYVAVHMRGVIYVKKHFEHGRDMVGHVFRQLLNGINSDAGFGSRIIFHQIYQRFAQMEFVEEIGELYVYPDNFRHASMTGLDIQMAADALYYPGECNIQIESGF